MPGSADIPQPFLFCCYFLSCISVLLPHPHSYYCWFILPQSSIFSFGVCVLLKSLVLCPGLHHYFHFLDYSLCPSFFLGFTSYLLPSLPALFLSLSLPLYPQFKVPLFAVESSVYVRDFSLSVSCFPTQVLLIPHSIANVSALSLSS